MNRKLLSILAAVCSVCILVIFGEWFYAVRVQKQALNSTISAQPALALDEMPGIDLTRQPEAAYADLVARPLFIKGRRPVNEPPPETVQAAADAAAAHTFDWQLNGVYTTKKGLSALFSRSTSKVAKDNYRKIIAGTDLDGWKLTEIHKDRVLLKLGDQQKELLLRKPKLKELSKNLNAPAPPIPNIPPTPEAPNPFNVPNSPQPAAGGFENMNNDNQ